MPSIDINDIAEKGVVKDEKGYQLPPEVWTTAENMHSVDGGMATMQGDVEVFMSPSVAPHFALPFSTTSQMYWLYTSLSKGYVWDGTVHTNITRQSVGVDVDYTASNTREWNGTLFAGIPILNNGTDIPQYWDAPDISHKLKNLANWPAAMRAAVVRSFGAYLVAIDCTISGSEYAHLVKWSSSANGPGQLPASWDESDESTDAGEYDLTDVDSGVLKEALRLGSKLFLYKEQSIWSMRYVGGRAIFSFDPFLDTAGILAARCAAVTGDGKKHLVATQDDIILHNGNTDPVSVLEKKMRRAVFNNIDTTNYVNSFMFTDPENKEVIFAYPESGRVDPNRGLVFNYKNGAITERDIDFANAATGRLEGESGDTWEDDELGWEGDEEPWSTQERRKIIVCDPTNTKFRKLNSGYLRNGNTYACTLQRVGLGLIGRKRSGEWIVNHQIMKFVDRIWPKCDGPCQIRVGFQMLIDGPITWTSYVSFDPETGVTGDIVGSGRAVALEFNLPVATAWKLEGYQIDITPDGMF